MSDIGTYEAIENEIKAALTSSPITGIADVRVSSSLPDLLAESIRKPVIGIIHSGTEKTGDIGIGRRDFYARTSWTIGIVISTVRPSQDNRLKLYRIMEEVRDRLHFLSSSVSPSGRFLFVSESYPPADEADLIAASVSFELSVILGR